jgi:hypothetical protein
MIAHVVNVLDIKPRHHKSHLHIAQPVTLDSMRRAKIDGEVELFSVKHRDDNVPTPEGFNATEDLREVSRHGMPHIGDIIKRLYDASDADIFIYTNVDIAVRPDFYAEVISLSSKHDGFLINRRDVPKSINGVTLNLTTYPLMFSERGKRHIGIDCCVFRRDFVPHMELGYVTIGFAPIGAVLGYQIYKQSKHFKWFKDMHTNYHIGNDSFRDGRKPSEGQKQNHAMAEFLYDHDAVWNRGLE